MRSPKVSVLMPVYNAGKYLTDSVESILNQTFSDFEFIILNDGSTDTSGKILDHFQNQDSRIRVISRENRGLIATLNEGLSYAQGEYIARMDADDLALPERFSKQVFFLDNHLDYVAIGTQVLLIDPENLPICPFSTQTDHEAIDQAHLAGKGGAICHPALMARRSALQHLGGYRATMQHAEDLDLFLRLAEVGKLANLPDTLMYYRMHPQSIGHQKRMEQRQSAGRAVAEACKRRRLAAMQDQSQNIHERQATVGELYQKWAWWALKAGHIETARKHSWIALKSSPASLPAWKVFACAVRGY